jgi:hypothetical protein
MKENIKVGAYGDGSGQLRNIMVGFGCDRYLGSLRDT